MSSRRISNLNLSRINFPCYWALINLGTNLNRIVFAINIVKDVLIDMMDSFRVLEVKL